MLGSGEKAYDKKKIIVVKILMRGKSEKNYWNKQQVLKISHRYVVKRASQINRKIWNLSFWDFRISTCPIHSPGYFPGYSCTNNTGRC